MTTPSAHFQNQPLDFGFFGANHSSSSSSLNINMEKQVLSRTSSASKPDDDFSDHSSKSSYNINKMADVELKHVTVIRENDVLLGRGSRSNQPGNVKFRQLIRDNRFRYLAASKIDKPKIAEDVVNMWRCMSPPGRFLSRKDENEVKGNSERKDEHAVWYDVGDKKARLKTSMALRERTPEAVNYLNIIRKQEVEDTQRSAEMVKQQLGSRQEQQQQQPDHLHHHHHHQLTKRGLPPVHSHSFAEFGSSQQPIAPIPPPNRRASFAGFNRRHHSEGNVTRGVHNEEHQDHHHRHAMPMHPRQMVSNMPQAPRRSSLLGERQAQLYIMQQQVKAQQLRLELEMQEAEMQEMMECGSHYMQQRQEQQQQQQHSIPHGPVSFPQNDFTLEKFPSENHRSCMHSSMPHVSSDDFVANTPTPFPPTNPFLPSTNTSSRSLSALVTPPETQSHKDAAVVRRPPGPPTGGVHVSPETKGIEADNLAGLADLSAEMEETEDVVVLEKFRFMLKGWAERENLPAGGETSDMDEELFDMKLPPTKRGVSRNVSGCSVQSALSDLMAMSIMSCGTEDEGISLADKSAHNEVWLDY